MEEIKVEDGYQAFRRDISQVVGKQLSKYLRDKRIAGKDDFKYLCRKISHTVRPPDIRELFFPLSHE